MSRQITKKDIPEWTLAQVIARSDEAPAKTLEFLFDIRYNMGLYRVRVDGQTKDETKSLNKAIEEYNKH